MFLLLNTCNETRKNITFFPVLKGKWFYQVVNDQMELVLE
jgi:hypothetical protein